MDNKLMRVMALICFAMILMAIGTVWAQDTPEEPRKLRLNLGFSAWPNNCDIPTGGQDSPTRPSFGPFFSLSYGKFRVGSTFFIGNFDIHPDHGIELDAANEPQFSDHEARKRGFTSDGDTKRIDFDLNVGYEFSRYVRLSLSLVVNRHEADILTYWFPIRNAQGEIVLPSDPSRLRLLDYVDTQFWIGQNLSGSLPIQTISGRFSLFYNASILVLAAESGTGVFEQPIGTFNNTGPRTSYTDENGNLGFPPRDLGSRSFGENVGVTFNSGVGFQLTDSPAVLIFGGYNIKFFTEDQSELIDHSLFKGPFAGISVNVH